MTDQRVIAIRDGQGLRRLRRHVLAAQGLTRRQPFGAGLAGLRKAITHLGYVQIDTISVVERAHHHVLHTRVPGFEPAMLNRLLQRGHIFEYWAHAAAFLPMADYRYSLPYKDAIRNGQTHWYKNPDRKLMQALLARIRDEGPLRSRDLEDARKSRSGWWDWKPAKRAIEQLYMEGEVMVSARDGFQKTYDLTERVLPAGVDCSLPGVAEHAAHLLNRQLQNQALVDLKSLTYLRRNPALRKAMKAQIDHAVDEARLQPIQLPSGARFYCPAGMLDAPTPRLPERLLILSPFDNVLIQRERLQTLFDFSYQLECYLPESKRRFGYFSLPLLYHGQFVGRMDCKAHRKSAVLEIKSLHLDLHKVDEARLVAALDDAVRRFRAFNACTSTLVGSVQPARLQPTLREVLHRA